MQSLNFIFLFTIHLVSMLAKRSSECCDKILPVGNSISDSPGKITFENKNDEACVECFEESVVPVKCECDMASSCSDKCKNDKRSKREKEVSSDEEETLCAINENPCNKMSKVCSINTCNANSYKSSGGRIKPLTTCPDSNCK